LSAVTTNEVQARALKLESLLHPPESPQADFFLLLGTELEARVQAGGLPGDYSGERLFSLYPETYKAVTEMLGKGNAARRIARALHVSPNTIRRVREREGVTVDALLAKARENAAAFVHDVWERARDEGDDMPLGQMFVPAGIAADTLQKLGGVGTAEVTVRDNDDLGRFEEYIEGLTIGLGSGVAAAKGGEGTRAVEGQSTGNRDHNRDGEGLVTTEVTTRQAGGDVPHVPQNNPEGGRGSNFEPPPCAERIHSSASVSEAKGHFGGDAKGGSGAGVKGEPGADALEIGADNKSPSPDGEDFEAPEKKEGPGFGESARGGASGSGAVQPGCAVPGGGSRRSGRGAAAEPDFREGPPAETPGVPGAGSGKVGPSSAAAPNLEKRPGSPAPPEDEAL
jgi:hypothetical protein